MSTRSNLHCHDDRCAAQQAAPSTAIWRFRLPKREIAYVRFIVESYEGLAQVSSEPGRGEMLWIVPVERQAAARALAASLSAEVGLYPLEC